MHVEKLSREELERLQETGADPAVATANGLVPSEVVADMANAVADGDFDAAFEIVRDNYGTFYDAVVECPEFKKMLVGIFGHIAAAGDNRGYRALGSTYSVVDSEDEMDYYSAVRAYELGMRRGDVHCAVEAGYLHYGGYRWQTNYEKAFACFAYAAIKGGSSEAYRGLGQLFASEWFGEGSDEMAWDMYELAVSHAEGYKGCKAYERLALYRSRGIPGYVERDPAEALRLYKLAEEGYRHYAEWDRWRFEEALERVRLAEDEMTAEMLKGRRASMG